MEGDLHWCYGSSDDNWDLHAVVRFACGGGGGHVTPPKASDEPFSWLMPRPQKDEKTDAAPCQPLRPADEDIYFFAAPMADTTTQPASPRNEAPSQQPLAKPRRISYRNGGGPERSKRKKKRIQVSKEVTRVPAGAPSPDPWAWRKYGQKPIKGSPYPRGYYRCSTDKECKARKQVERCRADHTTLIVTYTGGEHRHPVPLHRNSLSGTTRNNNKTQPRSSTSAAEEEPPQPQAAPNSPSDNNKPQASPPVSAGLPPLTTLLGSPEEKEHDDEEDDEKKAFAASDILLEDVEMEGEADMLQFLKPAPGSDNGNGWEDTMAEQKEPAPGPGNGGGFDDWEEVMQLFAKVHEPSPTTTRPNRTDGVSPAAMNITEEKFIPGSGISPWEAAAVSACSIWA
nr:unnamed protein product [Digitaria exilis]